MTSATFAPTLWDHEVAKCQPAEPGGPTAAGVSAHQAAPDAVAAGDRGSLDQLMSRLWGEVMGHRAVTCPWCSGEMRPRYGAAALPVGARCEQCGTSFC